MKDKSKCYDAQCCGCGLWISNLTPGGFSQGADGVFFTRLQMEEATRQHRRLCTNYTGRFHITAYWYWDVVDSHKEAEAMA